MKQRLALGLFSGGLDSILACRVVADQGVRVIALKFITPFFDSFLLRRRDEYRAEMQQKYGLEVEVVDVSEGYLRLLEKPAHGFGRYFNPCIDCKILMLTKARALMTRYNASFLVSGEVLGQRPMSQRRDTLRVIERDSGCTGMLLRPLSALLLEPTEAEQQGLVNRDLLFGIAGRGRRQQKLLAARLGITDYPTPAGGCMLTDPNLASRIKHFYHGLFSFDQEQRVVDDVRLLALGRHFKLSEVLWFIVGRNEQDNELLESLRAPDDWLFRMLDRPGPLGLLRHGQAAMAGVAWHHESIARLAGIVIRYGKKVDGAMADAEMMIDTGEEIRVDRYAPLAEDVLCQWRV